MASIKEQRAKLQARIAKLQAREKKLAADEKEKERILDGITTYESFAVTSINAASLPKRIIHSYSYRFKLNNPKIV